MSAFLGPIHYWLYNKIEVEEAIVQSIIDKALEKSFDTTSLVTKSNEMFGEKVVGKLEDKIQHDNIHGWLQGCIASVESRLAFMVTNLLNENVLSDDDIKNIFIENAKKCAEIENVEKDIKPEELYNKIYNYLLAGMPCDRVNEVVQSDDDIIKWNVTTDIHKKYWDNVSGDVERFNNYINSWVNTFICNSSENFIYKNINNQNIIERVK